jgi:hypothetical protein
MSKKILGRIFIVIFVSFLLYLIDMQIFACLYLLVVPYFRMAASFFGIAEWGTYVATFSLTYLVIIAGSACSLILKKNVILYAVALFLMIRCIEFAFSPICFGQTVSIKHILFSLLMLIIGLAICYLFFKRIKLYLLVGEEQ